MEINKLLNEICKNGSVYDEVMMTIIAPNYNLKPALISEISVYILENKKKIREICDRGEFKYYFIRMCQNQIHSNTSPFHKNNRIVNTYENIDSIDVIDEDDLEYKQEKENQFQQIKKARKQAGLTWYEEQIATEYFDENKSLRKIEKIYNIDHCSIYNTVNDIKTKINKQINK